MFLLGRARLLFKTDDSASGGSGSSSSDGEGEKPRKAHGAAVDQIVDHEQRLGRLEQTWLDRLFAEKKREGETPPKTDEPKKQVAAPSVFDELGDCVDPFRLFKDQPLPPPKAEAPAQDDGA